MLRLRSSLTLGVDHSEGSRERSTVDQKVEVDVDASRSSSRVDNLLDAVLPDADIRLLVLVLLGDKRRNVRLETASSDTHDDETNGEDGDGSIGLGDDLRNRGEDEKNMTDDGNDVGVLDCEITTKVLIS